MQQSQATTGYGTCRSWESGSLLHLGPAITGARYRLTMTRRKPTPAALYMSWADFTGRADPWQIREWCAEKARKANKRASARGITATIAVADVFDTLLTACGKCAYCGSLAVETIPSGPDGKSLSWYDIGRRVGSLDHVQALVDGGANARANLAWACMLCNSGGPERISGATDRGAIQVVGPDHGPACDGPVQVGRFTMVCGWCS